MKLQCGYLPGTNSLCYNPIQNVKFWGNTWKSCQFILDDKIIYTLTNNHVNNNKSYLIEQHKNNSDKIELRVNGQKVYDQKYLYCVDIVFDSDSQPEYELIESMIVDH